MEKNANNLVGSFLGKKMTRKEAIKKTGITALTTASLLFLTTNSSAAKSVEPGKSAGNPGNKGGNGHGRPGSR